MTISRNQSVKLTSLLSLIFFFSGFAALMYQVSWQRLLTVYYGVGAISITLIVSVYMFGLGIGSLFGGFLSERIKNKIILYFIVELLIGFFGLISLSFLDFLGKYTAGSNYALSFVYMFLFLSLPTFLMGITLPLLTKIFNSVINNFIDTVSSLYFINTLGAAVGAVFASYIIISFWGLDTAVYFAVIINFILAVMIFFTRYYQINTDEKEYMSGPTENQETVFGKIAYMLVFVTGFLAIGYEIVWFRVIGILVKNSTYAFSSILSVYLFGIALGSFGMKKYLKMHKKIDKKSLFFIIQFLVGLSVALIFIGYYYSTKYTSLSWLTYYSSIYDLHPYFVIPSFDSIKAFLIDTYRMVDIFFWPVIFMLVPTTLMGASFPLISLLALSQTNREGKTVGLVYFFNIAGNVLGGIVTGFFLLPYLGTETTVFGFSLVGILFGIFISKFGSMHLRFIQKTVLSGFVILFVIILFPERGQLYEITHIAPEEKLISYFEEGIDGIVMTYQHRESEERIWNYINGYSHGIRPGYGYYQETIEALSYVNKVENILIIGYGAGSITEAVLKSKEVKKVTLVEISDTLIKNLKKIDTFMEMFNDPRLNLIIDDGRRFLLRTNEEYDLILMDPIRTTTSYSNNLYSRQFFELASKHLTAEGILMVWMDEYHVMPKTVLSAFTNVRFYKVFGLASNAPFIKNHELENSIIANFSPLERKEIFKHSKERRYLGDQSYIKEKTDLYAINQDWKPVCEYYLGIKVRKTISGLFRD